MNQKYQKKSSKTSILLRVFASAGTFLLVFWLTNTFMGEQDRNKHLDEATNQQVISVSLDDNGKNLRQELLSLRDSLTQWIQQEQWLRISDTLRVVQNTDSYSGDQSLPLSWIKLWINACAKTRQWGCALEQSEFLLSLDSAAVRAEDLQIIRQHIRDDSLVAQRSNHFLVRFQGEKALSWDDSLFLSLESTYDSVSLLFDFYVQERLQVILYTDFSLSSYQHVPDWAGAFYDGILRLPAEALQHSGGRQVILHELTHAFVERFWPQTPAWLNEGLAQILDGTPTPVLVESIPPLEALQKSFLTQQALQESSQQTIRNYYQVSHLMTRQLLQSMSLRQIRKMLQEARSSQNWEKTFRSHAGFSTLELYERTLQIIPSSQEKS